MAATRQLLCTLRQLCTRLAAQPGAQAQSGWLNMSCWLVRLARRSTACLREATQRRAAGTAHAALTSKNRPVVLPSSTKNACSSFLHTEGTRPVLAAAFVSLVSPK